jgi:hypothetical protein
VKKPVAQDDGGPEVVASLSTAALDTLQLMWRAGSQALLVPEAKKEKDKLKVWGNPNLSLLYNHNHNQSIINHNH